MSPKHIDLMALTFQVMWRHRSRDYSIPHSLMGHFLIGGPLKPSLFL